MMPETDGAPKPAGLFDRHIRSCRVDGMRRFGARIVSMTHVHDPVARTVTERFEADGETRVRITPVRQAHDGRQALPGEAVVAVV